VDDLAKSAQQRYSAVVTTGACFLRGHVFPLPDITESNLAGRACRLFCHGFEYVPIIRQGNGCDIFIKPR